MSANRQGLVILISGSGTNLQAIIDAIAEGTLEAEIRCVISNRASAYGLERARQAGIATQVIDHRLYDSRESFDTALQQEIDRYEPGPVVLAGLMRILTTGSVRPYRRRTLNMHPPLPPKSRGLNTHDRAVEADEAEHGVTVHVVTEELDGGPNAIQAVLPIQPDDTADTLQARVQKQEHFIF